MTLILEIAAGIVLAVIVLQFWQLILAGAVILTVLAIAGVALFLVWDNETGRTVLSSAILIGVVAYVARDVWRIKRPPTAGPSGEQQHPQ